jgi:hypothetical protein
VQLLEALENRSKAQAARMDERIGRLEAGIGQLLAAAGSGGGKGFGGWSDEPLLSASWAHTTTHGNGR